MTGTYNNQYMVVDLKKVTLGRELANGTLWVIEQIPGLVVGADQTSILRAGLFCLHRDVSDVSNTIELVCIDEFCSDYESPQLMQWLQFCVMFQTLTVNIAGCPVCKFRLKL